MHTRPRTRVYYIRHWHGVYIHSSGNISLYNISMQFFSTCALLVPAFSAILCSFSLYPRGRFACMLSVFSALYRAFARSWAALVFSFRSCIIIHHDTIIYPWMYFHGYILPVYRSFLRFFQIALFVHGYIHGYAVPYSHNNRTAHGPRPRPHVVTP